MQRYKETITNAKISLFIFALSNENKFITNDLKSFILCFLFFYTIFIAIQLFLLFLRCHKTRLLMKSKILVFLFCMLLIPLIMQAKAKAMVVYMKDGSLTVFEFADNPVITYSNNLLIVKSDSKLVEIKVENITKVKMEDRPISISTVIKQPIVNGDRILFGQLPAGTMVKVFTADGKAVYSLKSDVESASSLYLSNLPHGLLIISTPTLSFKVNNR